MVATEKITEQAGEPNQADDHEINQDDGIDQNDAFSGIPPALASKMQEYSQKLQN